MEVVDDSAEKMLSFELKYCERCGGLWLRPMGGEQIYCVACGRAMAELPQQSRKAKATIGRGKVPWEAEGAEVRRYAEKSGSFDDEAEGGDAAGGAA
ncbi:MAG: hypothetical protein ABSF97_00330 [Candidatus Sulfotelmatobacter sp.]|jgi:Zn-finger nucleic acid-binding protein